MAKPRTFSGRRLAEIAALDPRTTERIPKKGNKAGHQDCATFLPFCVLSCSPGSLFGLPVCTLLRRDGGPCAQNTLRVRQLCPVCGRPPLFLFFWQLAIFVFALPKEGAGEQGRARHRRQALTMEEFQVPEDMGDPLALQVKTAGRFCASQNLPSLKDDSTERLNDIVDSVGSRLADGDADALSEQENFDDMFSLVR